MRESGQRCFTDQQLPRIGPALFDDGGRLAPDQLGPAGAKAAVAADGQLVGRAVGSTVAAFHRLHTQGVADGQRADGGRAKERGEVVGEAEIEVKTVALGFEIGDGLVLEIVGHCEAIMRMAV